MRLTDKQLRKLLDEQEKNSEDSGLYMRSFYITSKADTVLTVRAHRLKVSKSELIRAVLSWAVK